VFSSQAPLPTTNSKNGLRAFVACGVLFSCLLGVDYGDVAGTADAIGIENRLGRPATASAMPEQGAARTKIAEGEYAIYEQANSGGVGPFGEEVYNFHESWTLWRTENGQYQVEGVRRFESPMDVPHANRFRVDLSRDLTVIRMKEFAKLRWVRDSGPLSCEFLPTQLDCFSGGSDPKREIKLRTHLEKPYGLLWPISPFSFSGISREVERDATRATLVDLVRIVQPSAANPVQATTLEGSLQYLGEEDIETAGRKWHAHKFSLKVPLHPEFLFWTSQKGLLLDLAVEHQHSSWPEEGIRLAHFESWTEF
jgi:hypothetical protein